MPRELLLNGIKGLLKEPVSWLSLLSLALPPHGTLPKTLIWLSSLQNGDEYMSVHYNTASGIALKQHK